MMAPFRFLLWILIVWWFSGLFFDWLRLAFGSVVSGLSLFVFLAACVASVCWLVWWAAGWLRRMAPWTWWPFVGAPVTVWRMARTWGAAGDELGLSIPSTTRLAVVGGGRRGAARNQGVILKGQPLKTVPARRTGLWFSASGMVLRVRMHPGQTPEQWQNAADAFAHAWGVHAVRVASPYPGTVLLTAVGFDPLRHPREGDSRKAEKSRELVADVVAQAAPRESGRDPGRWLIVPDLLVFAAGVREDGKPWIVSMGRHYLVTGATQSGKSTLTVRGISELARRPVGLVGIDCKGGIELSPFSPRLSALATSRGEAMVVLEALIGEVGDRAALCQENGVRNIWDLPPSLRPAPLVVVVDEIAELFLSGDAAGKKESARCVTALVRIAQLGSALGVFVWAAGQRFGSDLGPGATLLRAQLAGRICHRVADIETAGMTLAGLPNEATAAALGIGMDMPGVAVAGDDSGAWVMARSAPVSIERAVAIATENAGMRIPVPRVEHALESLRGQAQPIPTGSVAGSDGTTSMTDERGRYEGDY